MLTSLEMRWFYAGKLPVATSNWFGQDALGGEMQPPEEREDIYLYSLGCEYLGIKLRQGRLEIKWRNAELGVVSWGGVEGKLEKWGKWLCEDSTKESFRPEVLEGKSWINVKKVRSQRLYDDCAIELTELNIKGNDWWTIGFETVGTEASKRNQLQNLASKVFQSYVNLELTNNHSYGYAKWLSKVV